MTHLTHAGVWLPQPRAFGFSGFASLTLYNLHFAGRTNHEL